jgi:hypothetical protein
MGHGNPDNNLESPCISHYFIQDTFFLNEYPCVYYEYYLKHILI